MEEKPAGMKVWSWTLWKITVDTSCLRGDLNLKVRAYDSAGNMQNGDIKDLYNLRGIMNNAPHSFDVKINV